MGAAGPEFFQAAVPIRSAWAEGPCCRRGRGRCTQQLWATSAPVGPWVQGPQPGCEPRDPRPSERGQPSHGRESRTGGRRREPSVKLRARKSWSRPTSAGSEGGPARSLEPDAPPPIDGRSEFRKRPRKLIGRGSVRSELRFSDLERLWQSSSKGQRPRPRGGIGRGATGAPRTKVGARFSNRAWFPFLNKPETKGRKSRPIRFRLFRFRIWARNRSGSHHSELD